ncbi:MAG: T9SS type A sorting domain-containing protein [Candidatus Cloacimonetes bacterium]|nr:T9SS type A sorting domain-containing protein [Candidatus Cloacimonadota bacterium]
MKFLLILVLCIPVILTANVITIPTDFTTIQGGIDNAVAGDTVLVNPGTYFENIEFSNKNNVTLCSLEATTGDATYIHNTIINGSLNEESVIYCYENLINCTIRGLSITGGSGHILWESQDINSWQVFGGGIFLDENISVSLMNLEIFENQASQGGGICFGYDNLICNISNVNVYRNIGRFIGGGVCFSSSNSDYSNITFDQINRCSIYNNNSPQGMDIGWCYTFGYTLDIYLDLFTWYEPNKYFVNYYASHYSSEPYPFPVFDIQRSYITPVMSDLYVSMSGDDTNTGLTPEEPLRTTWKAFQQLNPSEENPLSVHLLEGDFSEVVNGIGVSIVLKDNTILQGVSPDLTHVIAENFVETPVSGAISMGSNQSDMQVKDLSITTQDAIAIGFYAAFGSSLENLVVRDSELDKFLFCLHGIDTDIELTNILFENNYARWGTTCVYAYVNSIVMDGVVMKNNIAGAVPIQDVSSACGVYDIFAIDSIKIKNSKFINNTHNAMGNHATFRHMDINVPPSVIIDNCLYANNTSSDGQEIFLIAGDYNEVSITNSTFSNNIGTNCRLIAVSDTIDCFYNNIVANNNGPDYDLFMSQDSNLDYNLFTRTENIYSVYQGAPINFGANNLVGTDPIFVGGDPAFPEYYYLAGDDTTIGPSPAIDAGIMDIALFPPNYEFPLYDLTGVENRIYGNSIDIGCYEFPGFTGIEEETPNYPQFSLCNYPNPFNPTTTISFELPTKSKVTLSVFNIRGQRICTLIDEQKAKGKHCVIWTGQDDMGNNVPSGVYFYRMETPNRSLTNKMILLK